jgi:hypothetical protein
MKAKTEFSAALAAAKPCDRVGDRIFKVEQLHNEETSRCWTSLVMSTLVDADKKDRTVRVPWHR